MTFTARAEVVNAPFVPAGWLEALASLVERSRRTRGGYITVSVSLPRKPRTTGEKSQSNHCWGHAQQIAEYTGHEVDEIMVYAKARATKRGYPVDLIGGIPVPWSQTRISTIEAGYLIDELHQIAAELDVALVEGDEK